MTQYDDPNREAVGLEPIWTGAGEAPPEGDEELDAMTKDQLLDHAAGLGVDVPSGATKAEIRGSDRHRLTRLAVTIDDRRDEIILRVASLLHVADDDVWLAAAVDAAIEYATTATGLGTEGLPDTPLTVNGVVVFAQRLYLDTPSGVQAAVGDPGYEPIYLPEHLWRHVRHYFDHLDVAWGVA